MVLTLGLTIQRSHCMDDNLNEDGTKEISYNFQLLQNEVVGFTDKVNPQFDIIKNIWTIIFIYRDDIKMMQHEDYTYRIVARTPTDCTLYKATLSHCQTVVAMIRTICLFIYLII